MSNPRITLGKAIRHKEENTTIDNPNLIPWRVKLGIIRDNIDPRAHEHIYYVRAPNPGLAAQMADSLWNIHEKQYHGIPKNAKYPDTTGKQYVDKLSEDEWFCMYRFAQSMRDPGEYKFGGPEKSPSWFVYWTAGRLKLGAVYDINVKQAKEEVNLWLPPGYN